MARPREIVVVAALGLLVFVLGYLLGHRRTGAPAPAPAAPTQPARHVQTWYCTMHPDVRRPQPGRCPKCGMELVPLVTEGEQAGLGPRQLRLSPAAETLAAVEVQPVRRRPAAAEVRMVGKIAVDETRLAFISAWVPGRIDRLHADYTGIPIRPGDHLAELYSPDLLTAQQELIQALLAAGQTPAADLPSLRGAAQQTLTATREKLRLWGLTDEQIRQIEERRTPSDHLTIHAPIGGIVLEVQVREGDYVALGQRLLTLADLSHVWALLEAYESDVALVRYGQHVEFTVPSYPGESFGGVISFVGPVLDGRSRTVRVRVNVPNPAGKLKPEMLVHALVRVQLAADGAVIPPNLAGKWISPMHPEIVKDAPGLCDICGMPLVSAESLGYANPAAGAVEAPLVIPASAPLITGARAVVYVRDPHDPSLYEGREITLGPRAGDSYIVRNGLAEGELVVTHGNFKIDSSLQIQAKPSMMSPQGGAAPLTGHHGEAHPTVSPALTSSVHAPLPRFSVPDAFRRQLAAVFDAYFAAAAALVADNAPAARQAGDQLHQALQKADMSLLTSDAHPAWMSDLANLQKALELLRTADSLDPARRGFALLSDSLILVAHRFGPPASQPLYRLHCPMAFNNRGADWLQPRPDVENPYFGPAMPRCGALVETLGTGQP